VQDLVSLQNEPDACNAMSVALTAGSELTAAPRGRMRSTLLKYRRLIIATSTERLRCKARGDKSQ